MKTGTSSARRPLRSTRCSSPWRAMADRRLHTRSSPGARRSTGGSNPAGLAYDQRGEGFERVSGAQADVGAFELQMADLSIAKTGGPDPVPAGANLTWAVTVTNAGTAAAETVQLSDALQASTTFVSPRARPRAGAVPRLRSDPTGRSPVPSPPSLPVRRPSGSSPPSTGRPRPEPSSRTRRPSPRRRPIRTRRHHRNGDGYGRQNRLLRRTARSRGRRARPRSPTFCWFALSGALLAGAPDSKLAEARSGVGTRPGARGPSSAPVGCGANERLREARERAEAAEVGELVAA